MKSVFLDRKRRGKTRKEGKAERLAWKDRGKKARGASKTKRRGREKLGVEERKDEVRFPGQKKKGENKKKGKIRKEGKQESLARKERGKKARDAREKGEEGKRWCRGEEG